MSYYQMHQNANQGFNQGYEQPTFNQGGMGGYPSSLPTGSMADPNSDPSMQTLPKGLLAALLPAGYPGEPPLLEELGVNFSHIVAKTQAVLGLRRSPLADDVVRDSDLAGPLLFCILFGSLLLLSGKTHFGYIYGVALVGTVSLHALFRLMGSGDVDFLRTASVVGYCLLPLVILSAIAVLKNLDNFFGYILAVASVGWCTFAASGFFIRVLNLSNARPLVAYPLAMFYSVFALMTIFAEKKV